MKRWLCICAEMLDINDPVARGRGQGRGQGKECRSSKWLQREIKKGRLGSEPAQSRSPCASVSTACSLSPHTLVVFLCLPRVSTMSIIACSHIPRKVYETKVWIIKFPPFLQRLCLTLRYSKDRLWCFHRLCGWRTLKKIKGNSVFRNG